MNKKIVVVTGASSGLGRAIAQRLAQDGFSILAHFNNNREGAEETARLIKENGGEATLTSFDVTSSESCERELDHYFKNHEGHQLYGLVNNAGIHIDGLTGLMSDEDFDKVIRTNMHGPFYLMRYAIKKMMSQKEGVIINMTSLSGQTGNPGQINYAASKAGLIAMTKTLALELGRKNIRVNAVSPGLIETAMVSEIPGLESMIKKIPLQRMGQPQEVAGSLSFLFSPDAAYITGHTLSINGGLF